MSVGELKMGDGLLLKSFKDHPSPDLQLTFKGPKKGYHLAMWLGVYNPDEPGVLSKGVEERLNAMGWVFDPERAQALSDGKKTNGN